MGYYWLSLVGIAAALNYSGTAAFHALVLAFTPATSTNDLDSSALVYILTSSISLRILYFIGLKYYDI